MLKINVSQQKFGLKNCLSMYRKKNNVWIFDELWKWDELKMDPNELKNS